MKTQKKKSKVTKIESVWKFEFQAEKMNEVKTI
jgi:hypothetical protein